MAFSHTFPKHKTVYCSSDVSLIG